MSLKQLDTENADRDITSLITVLTHTPTVNAMCIGLIKLGDGAKNLDGTGGDFQLVITVGGQTVEPSPQTIAFSTAVRGMVWTTPFPVVANDEVIMRVLSPNGADADVDVTAFLYDSTFALPNAAPNAAGGSLVSAGGGLALDTILDAVISSRATPAQILTTAVVESTSVKGAAPTITQVLLEIIAELRQLSFSGTTQTILGLDGVTPIYTNVIDNAATPTTKLRAT